MAAIVLIVSGLVCCVLGRPEVTRETLVRVFAFSAFVTGSFGFVAGLELLVAGVAVAALVLRLMPRWLA